MHALPPGALIFSYCKHAVLTDGNEKYAAGRGSAALPQVLSQYFTLLVCTVQLHGHVLPTMLEDGVPVRVDPGFLRGVWRIHVRLRHRVNMYTFL